jgi:CheY-like chemotaxis protein
VDNWMPDLTGIEICEQIRLHDQITPILFCSGTLTRRDTETARIAGAQGYIGNHSFPRPQRKS